MKLEETEMALNGNFNTFFPLITQCGKGWRRLDHLWKTKKATSWFFTPMNINELNWKPCGTFVLRLNFWLKPPALGRVTH